MPITTKDRGLPNHVRIGGVPGLLESDSFAMTEQPRAIDRRRITKHGGQIDHGTMQEIRSWLADFLDLG